MVCIQSRCEHTGIRSLRQPAFPNDIWDCQARKWLFELQRPSPRKLLSTFRSPNPVLIRSFLDDMRPNIELPISSRYETILLALTLGFIVANFVFGYEMKKSFIAQAQLKPAKWWQHSTIRAPESTLTVGFEGNIWKEQSDARHYSGQECWSRFTALLASLLITLIYCTDRWFQFRWLDTAILYSRLGAIEARDMMTFFYYTIIYPSLHSHCGLWGQDMKRTVWCEANCSDRSSRSLQHFCFSFAGSPVLHSIFRLMQSSRGFVFQLTPRPIWLS